MTVVFFCGIGEHLYNKSRDTGKGNIFMVTHIADNGNVRNDNFIIIFTPFVLDVVTKNTAQTVFNLTADFDNKIIDHHGVFQIGFD